MIATLALAMAAVNQPPVPRNQQGWITPYDIPRAAVDANEKGYTTFTVLVSPDGKVARCDIKVSSGFQDLDLLACHLLEHRARFIPATDAAGRATYATWSSHAAWLTGNDKSAILAWQKTHRAPRADTVDVPLTELPKHFRDPTSVGAGILVTLDGQKADCGVVDDPQTRNLGDMACRTALASVTVKPEIDPSGLAISYIHSVSVRFGTSAALAK